MVSSSSFFFFFSSRRRHTRLQGDWSSDVCSSDLGKNVVAGCAPKAINGDLVVGSLVYVEVCPAGIEAAVVLVAGDANQVREDRAGVNGQQGIECAADGAESRDRKSTRLNSSHLVI